MILEAFKLDGRKALVTGASAGLGAAIALALAEAGADVACHGNSRSPEATCLGVRTLGRRTIALTADLSRPDVADDLCTQAVAALGGIDILVNNAGIIRRAASVEQAATDWDEVLAVNLTSVFRLSQAAARGMIAGGTGGRIVNIASLLSFQGGIGVAAYAASKGGVAQLTKALANEWAPHGITVNAIAPGYMRTDNTVPLQTDAARNAQIVARIPAGRWGEPEDLKGAAVFLASAASAYVTGHVLAVDGGWLGR